MNIFRKKKDQPIPTDQCGTGIIRKRLKFYGQVQGVGFRYRASYHALDLGLTGWVKNEWDGTVDMEAQGPESSIDKLLSLLDRERFIEIERMEQQVIPTVKNEGKFKVR